jgi:SPP1 gp7 family putative phage head morphogenesis protein
MSAARDWILTEAALATEEVLLKAYRVHVFKSSDPLVPKDFEAICQVLAHNLKGHAIPVEKLALKQAMAAVDAKWTDLGPEARGKVLDKAVGYFGDPLVNSLLPKVTTTFAAAAKDVILTTKESTILTHDLSIDASLNRTDERISQYVQKSQGHYVRDQYGARVESLGLKAKSIVAGGLQRGLGSAEIADKLREELSTSAGKGGGYWDMLAMVFANRARTMTQLASFGEAGIESYEWESVLDEVTSLQCRFMHGRVFPVAHAMAKFQEAEDAIEPQDIKTIQPFVNVGKMEGGGLGLYHSGADGERNYIAHVGENAVGQKDKLGTFTHAHDDGALMAAGIHAPPIHGRCRSTIVPSEKGVGGGGKPLPVAPAAPPGPPPKLVGGAAKAAAMAKLETFEETAPGMFAMDNLFEADPDPLFMYAPEYAKLSEPGVWDANMVSKKPQLDDLQATVYDVDRKEVQGWIKKPTKPGPVPKVVKYKGDMWILDGHEDLAAQKLLGQNKAYCQIVDLDKKLKIPEAPVVAPPPVTPPPLGMHDPNKVLTYTTSNPYSDAAVLNNVPFEPAKAGYWDAHVDIAEPELPPLGYGMKRSSGVVVVEPDGRVWVVEPKDHFGGYEHTFPKGKVDAGLSAQQNAMKEAMEESGLEVELTHYLGDFKGETSVTRYYVARRKSGQPWTRGDTESSSVKLAPVADAAKLLNKQRDKDILDALLIHQGKPPISGTGVGSSQVLPPAPPKVTGADVILGTKTGGAAGSNEGGFYTGTDGVKRYVKFYKDPAQAYGEVLANKVYRDLGIGAPETTAFEHEGKIAFASDILPDVKTLGDAGLTEARAKDVMKGFVADVLVGNWDAAGMSLDNMVVRADGSIARIDNGGSFLMRAKAGRKPDDVLNKITEWDNFFKPSKNPAYAKIALKAGVSDAVDMKDVVVPAIQKIVSMRDGAGGWAKYVEKVAPGLNEADKKKMIEILDARTKLLEAKAKELQAVMPKPKPSTPAATGTYSGSGAALEGPTASSITQSQLDEAKEKIEGGMFTLKMKDLGFAVDEAPPYLPKQSLMQALVVSGMGAQAKSVPIDDIIVTIPTCTKGGVTPKLADVMHFKAEMSKVSDATVVNVNGKLYLWNGSPKLVAAKLTGQKTINVTYLDATKLVNDPHFVVPAPARAESRPSGSSVHPVLAHLPTKKLPTDDNTGLTPNKPPTAAMPDRNRSKFEAQCTARLTPGGVAAKGQGAVRDFSSSAYHSIRAAEELPEAKARAQLGSSYDSYVKKGQDILKFFDTTEPTPIECFRGIHDKGLPDGTRALSDEVFREFATSDVIHFKATTSTSWRPDVGRSFGNIYSPTTTQNRVLFHIVKSQSGVAIDTISRSRGEDEILFKKGTSFKVLARHRAEGYNDVMVIEMEEIPSGKAPAPGKAPRKPRTP